MSVDTAHRKAVGEVLLAAVLFGTTGTSQALGPTGTTPLGVGAARLIVGGAGLLASLRYTGGSAKDAFSLWLNRWGILGGVCTALYQVAFFAAVMRAGVALGTLITIGSGPFLTGILSAVLLKERPTRVWVYSTSIAVFGLVLLTLDGATRPDVDLVGVLLALISGLGYALYTIAGKKLIGDGHHSSTVMAASFSLGGVLLVPVLLTQPLAWLASWQGIALALYLGIVTTTIGYLLFGRGLRVLDAGPVTTLVLAEPVVATLLGVLVLGERLGAIGWFGCLLVLAGLALQGVWSSRAVSSRV